MIAALLAAFTNAQAVQIDLGTINQKNIQVGALYQDQNQPVNDVIVFKRDVSTPKKVELTYSFNYVERECVDFKIESKWIPELSKFVCKRSGGDTHDCRPRDFQGFHENKRKCIKKGLELKTKNVKVVFHFKKATSLAEGAEETFTISLTQKKMKTNLVKVELSSVESTGIYKFSKLGRNYYFKIK